MADGKRDDPHNDGHVYTGLTTTVIRTCVCNPLIKNTHKKWDQETPRLHFGFTLFYALCKMAMHDAVSSVDKWI